MEPLVQLKGVSRVFPGGVSALKDLSLTADRGELVVIMGPSGSGKSTLLHLVAAMDRPTSGQLVVAGEDIAAAGWNRRTAYRLERVGFVFQQFNLLPAFTLAENVELPLILAGWTASDRAERVRDLAARLDIAGCVARFPHEVSGGQQQRAAIARALAARPCVLVADEPTATLDTVNARRVFDLIRDLVGTEGILALVATHDTRLLTGNERVVRLVDGLLELQ